MRPSDVLIERTLELVGKMIEIADEGDRTREDSGCGVLYGVLRDSAFKIKKLAEDELEVHALRGPGTGQRAQGSGRAAGRAAGAGKCGRSKSPRRSGGVNLK